LNKNWEKAFIGKAMADKRRWKELLIKGSARRVHKDNDSLRDK